MTEDEAFVAFTRRMVGFRLSEVRSIEEVTRETVRRCPPETRALAARRLERARAEGGGALPRLWSGSQGELFTPVEQLPASTDTWIAVLRDAAVISDPWPEPTITFADG